MPTYTFYYYNAKGRGELTRLIFKQAGVDFKDNRFNREEWVSTYKAQSPFGVCPWLDVDGVVIGGSQNIARFVAEQVGLAGSNPTENAALAAIADCFNDCFEAGANPLFYSKDKDEKEKGMEQYAKDCCKWLSKLEDILKDENSWLFGDKLTWVDIAVTNGLQYLKGFYPPTTFDNYPKIFALTKRVEEQPRLANWMKIRPETSF